MTANASVGTWRLVSFAVRDEVGTVTHLFGPDAAGFITYAADGYMAVQFGRAERPRLDRSDWVAAPPGEIAAAARDYFAYCGTYEVGDGTVVRRVALSLMPKWI